MYPTAAYAKATNIFLFFLYYCILTTVEQTSDGVTSQLAEPEESLHNLGINHLWLKDVSGRGQIREDDFFFLTGSFIQRHRHHRILILVMFTRFSSLKSVDHTTK